MPLNYEGHWAQRIAGAIEDITGIRPQTCPWRAMYHPLVGEVVRIATLADKGLGPSALAADPPAILLDALSTYIRAREVTRSDEMKRETEERKRRG